jgi:hypothetical protein
MGFRLRSQEGLKLRIDRAYEASRTGRILVLAGFVSLSACSGFGGDAQLGIAPYCADDSASCIAERGAMLRSMLNDKDRSWVRQPAQPAAYAAGVRLFAFKGRKRELTCEELAIGRREADAAPASLRGAGAAGLTPAQISRSEILAAEVSRELQAEIKRRCRA